MSLVSRLMAPPQVQAQNPGPLNDFWYEPVGIFSAAGVKVSPETAIRCSAVYAACKVVSESVGMLPLITYERLTNGGKERATDHPLYDILRWEPNQLQTANEFWKLMIVMAMLWGKGMAEIIPGQRGFADSLMPLPPNRTRQVVERNRVSYEVTEETGFKRTLLADEVFVVPGLQLDVVTGLSIPEVARDVIGLALATEQYGARFFSQSSQPGGILSHPHNLSPEAQERLAKSWQRAHSGLGNAHTVAIVEEGMTYTPTAMSGEEAQMNETRQRQVEEVSRFFRVPLHKINDLSRATFSNIEEQSLEFVTDTLMPWTTTIEQRIRKQLILAKERFFAEFLLDDLLRGKAVERAEVYAKYLENGVMSRNEVRVRENLNPLPGLDEPQVAANIGSVPNRGNEQEEPEAHLPIDRAVKITTKMAERTVRREIVAITEAAKKCASDTAMFHGWLEEFYGKHAALVMDNMQLEEIDARRWCESQKADVLNFGISVLESWADDRPGKLAQMALREGAAA